MLRMLAGGCRRGMVLLCLAFISLSGIGGCRRHGATLAPLRVGIDSTYPPMEFRDEKTGKLQGFDVDIIKAVARRLDRRLELVNIRWDGGIAALLNGQFDLFIDAVTITAERAASIDFSDPYFAAGQVIIVRADNTSIKGLPDLAGRRAGVCLGTTGDIAVTGMRGVKVARFDKTYEALFDLLNGGVDAVVADSTTLMWEAAHDSRLRLVDRKPFTVEYYGICGRKGEDALMTQVNKALAEIKADGEYDRICAKWFGD